jgi:hypothetical protein
MKRLKLDAFKAKNLKKETTQQVDELLGQVLGDCHDQPKKSGSGIGSTVPAEY